MLESLKRKMKNAWIKMDASKSDVKKEKQSMVTTIINPEQSKVGGDDLYRRMNEFWEQTGCTQGDAKSESFKNAQRSSYGVCMDDIIPTLYDDCRTLVKVRHKDLKRTL